MKSDSVDGLECSLPDIATARWLVFPRDRKAWHSLKHTQYVWVNLTSDSKEDSFPSSGNLSAEDDEIREQRRDVTDLKGRYFL